MTVEEEVTEILRDLRMAIKTESALIRRDGNLVFSEFSYGFAADEIFGAMSASMLGAAKRLTTECKKGFPKKIIIQTGNAHIIITNAGSKALLMCMVDAMKATDRILREIDRAADKIKVLL